MPTFNLTKRSIDAIPLERSGQKLYRDSELPGFGLRVGTRSKVFFAEGQVDRRTVRATIGKYGPLTPDVARKLALKILAEMAQGRDPNAAKCRRARDEITLGQAFDRFFAAKGDLSVRTVDSYRRSVRLYLADWTCRPLRDITRAMVLARHRALSSQHGALTANSVMRHLRSVYNFTAAAHEEFPPNPVYIMTQARAWAPEKRRRRLVSARSLPSWWAATMLEPPLSRDFLTVALFTGMRRREIAGLRWEDIDLKGRTLTVPRTKNGDPLVLPLSGYLTRVLMKRKLAVGASQFVFPSRSASGHVEEVKTFTGRVTKRCGVEFTLHDLRRTFVTIAESIDVPAYTLKRLLNHRGGEDVTSGYIIIDVERLREPVEKIALKIEAMTEAANEGNSANKI